MGVLVLTAIGFWNKEQFPSPYARQLEPNLTQEPIQTLTSQEGFYVEQSDQRYHVKKLYDYELWGYVVSFRKHRTAQKNRTGDHLNIADLCVVWGENAHILNLNDFNIWNQNFTCFVQPKNTDAANAFKPNQLSNNHLITNNTVIREAIANVEVGDQIHLKGWLAGYKHQNQNSYRMSSTTREDKGNGACETIYVNEFNVLQKMETPWKTLWHFGVIGILIYIVLFFITLFIKDRKLKSTYENP